MIVRIIYDGNCPFCSDFVKISNLKKSYADVRFHNARESGDPLVVQLKSAGYQLNDGMIVMAGEEVLYGAEAARFIVRGGSGGHRFALYKSLLRNKHLSKLFYPILVFLRKLYFRMTGMTLIDEE